MVIDKKMQKKMKKAHKKKQKHHKHGKVSALWILASKWCPLRGTREAVGGQGRRIQSLRTWGSDCVKDSHWEESDNLQKNY